MLMKFKTIKEIYIEKVIDNKSSHSVYLNMITIDYYLFLAAKVWIMLYPASSIA
jgi:hypothetical protein